MNFLPFLLYAISVAGFTCLIIFIYNLVTSFTGWNHTYKASVLQTVVNIPKPGRYSVCVLRDRFWLLSGEGNYSSKFMQCDFSIHWVNASKQVPYHKKYGIRSRGFSKTSLVAGYFDVPVSGAYIISHQCGDDFWQSDDISIQKHLSTVKFTLLVLGIIGSSILFIAGAIVATLV